MVTITGASGHIGANLVRALIEQGREVRAIVYRDRRALEGLDVEQMQADILDRQSLERAFRGCETVYHLAVHISISKRDAAVAARVNLEGTRNVVEACRTAGVKRLMHFSSIHALSALPRGETIDEKRPLAGEEAPAYDRSKAEADRLVLRAVREGLNAVVLNPTAVLGPHDYKPSYMGRTLLSIYHGDLKALVRGGFDWVDVRDIVHGALQAEGRAEAGERYLLSGNWLPVSDLARLVEEVAGRRVRRFVFPLWLARTGVPFVSLLASLRKTEPLFTGESLHALRNHRYVSHEKASRELGYRPRPLPVTIRDTFSWFEERGYLETGSHR
jgi:dihydroflavonol-4-reductase